MKLGIPSAVEKMKGAVELSVADIENIANNGPQVEVASGMCLGAVGCMLARGDRYQVLVG